MPFFEEVETEWEDWGYFIKQEVNKIENAIRNQEPLAVEDTYPIRSLISTFNGYAPAFGPRWDLGFSVEELWHVSKEFRLAVTLEYSVSLMVSSLIREYYRDGELVYALDWHTADIEASFGILVVLKDFIIFHKKQFVEHGAKYKDVRCCCAGYYRDWNDARTPAARLVEEIPFEHFRAKPGSVVMGLISELTRLRKMIQTGDMDPAMRCY